jgi:AcrR family transcriptional regulator
MKNKKFIRARSEEQKEVRIQEIVSATERLYDSHRYEDITFVQIAKEAGFTRSNLYKYFISKEEIFLEFLKHDMKLWKDELLNNFLDSNSYSIDKFIDIWIDVLQNNRRLTELTSILYLHLEKEASYESLLNFKRSFIKDFEQVVIHLTCKIKGFTTEKVAEFISMQGMIGIGLYQMTDLSENQQKILEQPEYAQWKIDFRQRYMQVTKYLLEGLLKD